VKRKKTTGAGIRLRVYIEIRRLRGPRERKERSYVGAMKERKNDARRTIKKGYQPVEKRRGGLSLDHSRGRKLKSYPASGKEGGTSVVP